MKTKKLKLLTTFLLVLPLCVVILGAGCDDGDELKIKTQLLGEWVEQEPFTDGVCDTIVFKEDNTIELYSPFQGCTYSLPTSDSIEIIYSDKIYKFYFSFNNENELTIFNFFDRTITSQIKDLTFKKID